MPSWPADDPAAATDILAAARQPYLIGVRHHSPVLARAVPALLEAARPDTVLIELPMEFAPWIEWLAHPDAIAPLALGGVRAGAPGSLAFYPFADFSPELAAIRWAARHGVPVEPCDLPLAARVADAARSAPPDGGPPGGLPLDGAATGGAPALADRVRRKLTGRTDEDMWDRLVEVGAAGSTPEEVRRAALAVGWALRGDPARVDPFDRAREAWMRARIAAAGGRVAAVIGAFHAPALLESGSLEPVSDVEPPGPAGVVTSLVPYPFDLLDSRSGYPAGIRDPQWQQRIVECDGTPAAIEAITTAFAVRIAVALRLAGHPAGPAEAAEAGRVAADLARLRGLPAPGRGELVEAVQSVFAHGEVHGRGRAVAAAMQDVLIGSRTGRLAPGTPRSGLVPSVLDLLAALRLPGPATQAPARRGAQPRPSTVRLDPLRSTLDRRRHVALERLSACGVVYAEPVATAGAAGTETLTTVWQAGWQPATEPTIAVAGLHGITLEQAAEGMLRAQRRIEVDRGGPTAGDAITGLARAAATGLPALLTLRISDVALAAGSAGTLPDIVAALDVLESIAGGHVPGTDEPPDGIDAVIDRLDAAAVRELSGLAGSDRLDDARALVAVAHRADATGRTLRLHNAVTELAEHGSPLMAGAAGAVAVLLGRTDPDAFGIRVASWIDLGGDDLRIRLSGMLIVAGSVLTASEGLLAPVVARVESLTDADFTRRLPGLRSGFDALSPAARERLRLDIERRVGLLTGTHDPVVLGDWLTHDQAGREAVDALRAADVRIPPAARWRLVLGRPSADLPPLAGRAATALDQVYGHGHGEGSRGIEPGASGGGRETARPGAREWAGELTDVFGTEVCQQVLGEAVRRGDREAAFALDAEAVRPSVELLHAVLSLAGGLPEAQVARLRPLVARVVAELTARLASQLRPALAGLTTPRPTRRDTGRLDLRATIAANLRSATRLPDGRTVIVPDRLRFAGRSKRTVDWRLILVVDVSGSMEASTVWAALTAAVLASLPAVTTHFLTVSTEIIDLSGRADDPLGLLLEVSVGGGTHLALGLRHARSLVTVPARTMIVMISDFEEGYPVEHLVSEVRTLAESGCRLLGCASLDDQARPRYAVGIAEQLVGAGMPVAALSPLALARWVAEQVR